MLAPSEPHAQDTLVQNPWWLLSCSQAPSTGSVALSAVGYLQLDRRPRQDDPLSDPACQHLGMRRLLLIANAGGLREGVGCGGAVGDVAGVVV